LTASFIHGLGSMGIKKGNPLGIKPLTVTTTYADADKHAKKASLLSMFALGRVQILGPEVQLISFCKSGDVRNAK